MGNEQKITSGKSLSKTIRSIIKESIKGSLARNAQKEADRQKEYLGEEDDDLFADEKDSKKPENKTSKTMEDETEKLKKADINVDDVIEKLNTIRSGKSFKDEVIRGKLSEYTKSLTSAERTALFAFLKGIAQLVTGEFEPEAAMDPSDDPADVEMKKGPSGQKKSIKPNVIKTPKPVDKSEKKKSSAEDTSGPVPIKPKK